MDEHKIVLDWCNREREYRNRPTLAQMPEGIPGDCCRCPVARALGSNDDDSVLIVDGDTVHWLGETHNGGDPAQALPDEVIAWVRRFDEGYFPELQDRDYRAMMERRS